MTKVTFRVLEGVDRGRVFRDLPIEPHIMIGREEGNHLRLNDERVSRFHAKVQVDNGDVILTDLESTNGTRINGKAVQIRRLRPGDQIWVGRSLLLFGSPEEIAARLVSLAGFTKSVPTDKTGVGSLAQLPATLPTQPHPDPQEPEADFEFTPKEIAGFNPDDLLAGTHPLPPLPRKMTPSQAARVAEVFDLLHRGLAAATENIQANDEGTQINLSFADWQRVLSVQMLLALYLRAVTDPEALTQ